MAENSALEYETASGNDYAQHVGTYRSFIQLIKWGVAASVITLALMAWFLT
ncbi:MAG TPA: aa3-type cytochrome c oxidase subunit IV [Rhodoplanes sp.]|nr:aa3-type cytochrome c oxidase subunit IV [Rhodoplanes sp.]